MIILLILLGGLAFFQYKWTDSIIKSKDKEIERLSNRVSELESKITK